MRPTISKGLSRAGPALLTDSSRKGRNRPSPAVMAGAAFTRGCRGFESLTAHHDSLSCCQRFGNERDAHAGMAEPLRDDPWMQARREHERRVSVAYGRRSSLAERRSFYAELATLSSALRKSVERRPRE